GALVPGFLEPHRLVQLAVVHELDREHPAGPDRFAIGLQRLIDHAETVAAAQRTVKVDVAGENLDDLAHYRIGNARLVGRGEQRAADGGAAHPGGGHQRRRFDARSESAPGCVLDDQALERAIVFRSPARTELAQGVDLGGLYRDSAAAAAQHLGAERRVAAQIGRGWRIVHAKPREQRLHRVAGPGDIGAKQLEAVHVELPDLLLQRQCLDGFQYLANRQTGRIGAERSDGERAAATTEQERG